MYTLIIPLQYFEEEINRLLQFCKSNGATATGAFTVAAQESKIMANELCAILSKIYPTVAAQIGINYPCKYVHSMVFCQAYESILMLVFAIYVQ